MLFSIFLNLGIDSTILKLFKQLKISSWLKKELSSNNYFWVYKILLLPKEK